MGKKIYRPLSPQILATSVVLSIVSAAIFAFDTLTDYAIAAAVFYTAVVLVSTRVFPHRTVIGVAASCIVFDHC